MRLAGHRPKGRHTAQLQLKDSCCASRAPPLEIGISVFFAQCVNPDLSHECPVRRNMRLINTKTLELTEFQDTKCPTYAVLSHTWETEEVSFADWARPEHRQTLKGFAKIEGFCKLAADHYALEWAWTDTCCIDKGSSAELTEAINSMYRYYREADICLVYLFDVPAICDTIRNPFVRASKWFTRGWTLQELIAPRRVVFYGSGWNLLGSLNPWVETEDDLETIEEYTGIDRLVLNQLKAPSAYSIATRMSWASKRQTTRLEDEAYCLLGLFDVSLPLIYGEGRRAFLRLQEEIIRRSTDHSIFAWKSDSVHGQLLATSPAAFTHAAKSPIVPCYHGSRAWGSAYSVDNLGLRLSLPLIKCETPKTHTNRGSEIYHAVLNCRYKNNPKGPLAITVMRQGHGVEDEGDIDDEENAPMLLLPTSSDRSDAYICNSSHLGRLAVVQEMRLIGHQKQDSVLLRQRIDSGKEEFSRINWKLHLNFTKATSLSPLRKVEAIPHESWVNSDNVCVLNDRNLLIAFEASWLVGYLGFWISSPASSSAADSLRLQLMVFHFAQPDTLVFRPDVGLTVGAALSAFSRDCKAGFKRFACDVYMDDAVSFYLQKNKVLLEFKLTSKTWMKTNFATLAVHTRMPPTSGSSAPEAKLPSLQSGENSFMIHRPFLYDLDPVKEEPIDGDLLTVESAKRDSVLSQGSRRSVGHRLSRSLATKLSQILVTRDEEATSDHHAAG